MLKLLPALLLALAAPVSAAPVQTDHVEAELVLRDAALVPGTKTLAGLRMKIAPHWHTYWQNPGDSGAPATIEWKLPGGIGAGAIQWPQPMRIPVPPLMNYGYEGEIVLPVELTVPGGLPAGSAVRIAARADWLVCSDVCLPRGADLETTVPVRVQTSPDPRWAGLFDKAMRALPQQSVAGAAAQTANGSIELTLPGLKPASTSGIYVYSSIEGLVEHSAAQRARQTDGGVVVTLAVSRQLAASEPRIAGVVAGAGDRPLAFDAPMSGRLVAGTAAPQSGDAAAPLPLMLAISFALLGGLLLNLMPCVFPVLSLKVLGFTKGGAPRVARMQGIAFAVGVVGSFLVLAGILLALRAAGEAVGWGFQLQSPLVVTLLALLFFLLALNLSGVFEFGGFVPSRLAGAALRHPLADSFFSGVLAAVVASPCTAPFMGAALGYALTQNAATSLVVFAAMGTGMALPYVLLAFQPGLLRLLPAPGAWLPAFKQFMAFPLYATVVWLAWVLLVQLGPDGVIGLGAGLVIVAFAAWVFGRSRAAQGRAVAAVALLAGVWAAFPGAAVPSGKPGDGWLPYSAAEVSRLNAGGKAVFVDFTAAWCVTCQVNKKVVLESTAVRAAFDRSGLALMRADWTSRDPAITTALAAFGRSGVPVYALHVPGKEPRLLPELLTERIVIDAISTLR